MAMYVEPVIMCSLCKLEYQQNRVTSFSACTCSICDADGFFLLADPAIPISVSDFSNHVRTLHANDNYLFTEEYSVSNNNENHAAIKAWGIGDTQQNPLINADPLGDQ